MTDGGPLLSAPGIDDDTVVFARDGALWEGSVDGGHARRRTVPLGVVEGPVIDRERDRVFFTTKAGSGTAQVWSVDADATLRQHTWLPEPCRLLGRYADGRLVVASSAGQPFRQLPVGLLLDPETGALEALDAPPLSGFCSGPGRGRAVVVSPGVDPRVWRGYRGGARGEVWLLDGPAPPTRLPTGALNVRTALLVRDRVYLVGDDGDPGSTPNLWSCRPDGAELRQLTRYDGPAVHSAATDGRRIVYCVAGELHVLGPGAYDTRLTFEPERDAAVARPELPLAAALRDVSGSSTDADLVAVTALGQLLELSPGGERLDRVPLPGPCVAGRYLPDGRLLAMVRTPDGDEPVLVSPDRHQAEVLHVTEPLGDVVDLAVAGDVPVAVVSTAQHRVLAVDLDSGRVRVVDVSAHGPVDRVDVTADGLRCCYALPTGPFRTVVRVSTTDAQVELQTDPALADLRPRFDRDGAAVHHLSVASGSGHRHDLVTHLHRLELETGRVARVVTPPVWFADLVVEGDEAFLLLPPPSDAEPASDPLDPFTPVAQSGAAAGAPRGGPTVWVVVARRLWSAGAAGVIASTGSAVFVAPPAGGAVRQRQGLPATVQVDAAELHEAMVLVAWRAADVSAVGDRDATAWRSVLQSYVAQARRAHDTHAARAVVQEMLSHLRISHAAVREPSRSQAAYGHLGVDVAFDVDLGAWTVTTVPDLDPPTAGGLDGGHGTPAGLAEPALGVAVGDRVVEIDGRPPAAGEHPASRLRGRAGHEVRAVLRTGTGRRRVVRFTALADERPLRYRDWLVQCRRIVLDVGAGQVDHVHLPDVSERTLAAADWWLRCREESRGLVVDVRYNEGGSFAAELSVLFSRPPAGHLTTRTSVPHAVPPGTGHGRLVVVTNRFTSSGGELLAQLLREQAHAVLVGERTFGAGVGHGAERPLPDGSVLLLPELRVVDPAGWVTVENHGVDADVEVPWYARAHAAAGAQRDQVLAAAVALASEPLPPHGVTTER